ncbi:hypothetical protein ABFS83_05G124900 [Erythranthe nasuta]
MAALKLFIVTVFLSIFLAGIGVNADASLSDADGKPRSDGPDSAVLEQLKSKIHTLENHIEEKTREIKNKDEVIASKEKIIKEKSDGIVSLESEIASLQKKGKLDATEKLEQAYARADELEKKVEKLIEDLNVKIKEKEQLEARVIEAEKKASEMSSKADKLQKIIDDQKTKLRKTERALQIAEEEMMKSKFEATTKAKELMEVHGAWFPHWLAVHCTHYQSVLEKKWEAHGKPAVEVLVQKAIEKKAQAGKWAAPHVETVKTKWVPAIKEQWVVIASNVEPHVQMLTTKSIEVYGASKDALAPHITKVVVFVDPYFQELRKVTKPYIDQVATASRPHVDKLHSAVKPYTQHAVHAYGKFLESATTYHHQVQHKVQEKLKSHELTNPLATKELVWFAASALLALPVIFLIKIFSAIFCKKTQKRTRNGNPGRSRRKVKHVHHAEK